MLGFHRLPVFGGDGGSYTHSTVQAHEIIALVDVLGFFDFGGNIVSLGSVLATKPGPCKRAVAALMDLFFAASTIGTEKSPLQSFIVGWAGAKDGRSILARFSSIQTGIVKGGRAITMVVR